MTLFSLVLLTGCGSGTWTVNTWGEEYIEDTIPAEIFEDGCSVTYESFEVAMSGVALLLLATDGPLGGDIAVLPTTDGLGVGGVF